MNLRVILLFNLRTLVPHTDDAAPYSLRVCQTGIKMKFLQITAASQIAARSFSSRTGTVQAGLKAQNAGAYTRDIRSGRTIIKLHGNAGRGW
ncbi:hypothetical protein AD933_10420 [Acetobacter malorum]|uniref:Uncharacterized protein n=1 Tax=Acetobacter malorum TaxID=178901 RepID=A0A149RLR3_9PROT|nr:hypothetical protein AD933_10420 [Acetobacter malorum]TCS31928.1 hypothetical protein EDC15_11478 [Acetobacter aceti NBRC 14818]